MKHRVAVSLILTITIAAAVTACGVSRAAPRTVGGEPLRPPRVPITAARASNGLFSIFPGSVAVRACRIPHGGPLFLGTMTLPGTCVTRLARDRKRVIVSFTQWWGGVLNHDPSNRIHGSHQHTWQVILSPALDVVATLSAGAIAPQYWR